MNFTTTAVAWTAAQLSARVAADEAHRSVPRERRCRPLQLASHRHRWSFLAAARGRPSHSVLISAIGLYVCTAVFVSRRCLAAGGSCAGRQGAGTVCLLGLASLPLGTTPAPPSTPACTPVCCLPPPRGSAHRSLRSNLQRQHSSGSDLQGGTDGCGGALVARSHNGGTTAWTGCQSWTGDGYRVVAPGSAPVRRKAEGWRGILVGRRLWRTATCSVSMRMSPRTHSGRMRRYAPTPTLTHRRGLRRKPSPSAAATTAASANAGCFRSCYHRQ